MVNEGDYNEIENLKQLAIGNQLAFTKIYDRYWPATYKVALKYLGSEDAALDVVHDVFLNVWRNREKFQEVIQLKYYLITSTKNDTFKKLKKIIKERETEKVFVSDHSLNHNLADRELEGQQLEEILQKAIESLTPDQRRIFVLHRQQGLSHKAIAEKLNLSILTVKTHMTNALRSIRQYLHRHTGSAALVSILIRILNS